MDKPDWLPEPPDGWSAWTKVASDWFSETPDDSVRVSNSCVWAYHDELETEASIYPKVVTLSVLLHCCASAGLVGWLPTATASPTTPGLWRYSDGIADGVAQVCLDGGELAALIPGVAGKVALGDLDFTWKGPV